jgi:hypothetical protein
MAPKVSERVCSEGAPIIKTAVFSGMLILATKLHGVTSHMAVIWDVSGKQGNLYF